MNCIKGIQLLLASAMAFLIMGCTSSESSLIPNRGDYIYRGHDFGPDRDAAYRQGVEDGCRTSDGDYTKNHVSYKTDESYHNGWEHGRLHCKGVMH